MTYSRVPIMVLLLLACWNMSGAPRGGTEAPVEATLCNIVSHANRIAGQRVRFHATVISDGFEHTALVERGCKQGIISRIPDQLANDNDIRAFERALASGGRGTSDKTVTATFTGVLSLQSKKLVLEVEGVRDLTITPASKPKQ